MPLITMRQLQERTKIKLFSDSNVYQMHAPYRTYRQAQRATEGLYHRQMRTAATRHFLEAGWDVFPHGVGVEGAFAISDLAISKRRKIVLVECSTQWSVNFATAEGKRRLEQFFPLWFVIQAPVTGETLYRRRAERLANRNRVFVWSKGSGLKRHSIRR